MITGQDVAEEARKFLGVPFMHQGRTRSGLDCLGLAILVARSLGLVLPDFDANGYGRTPHQGRLLAGLEAHLLRVDEEPQPGLLAAFRFGSSSQRATAQEQHVGIIGSVPEYLTLIHIHSSIGNGRGVEHRYSSQWRARTSALFRFPGVSY